MCRTKEPECLYFADNTFYGNFKDTGTKTWSYVKNNLLYLELIPAENKDWPFP